MRIALFGYGAVAAIHARQLSSLVDVSIVCVSGPDSRKAAAFARRHDIPSSRTDLRQALSEADAAVIASPPGFHATQALQALELGVHVLVELPACETPGEAYALAETATRRNLTLMCAHTSRYLGPYREVRGYLATQQLGTIQQVHYLRHVVLAPRSWIDHPLLHHASHAIDLLLEWFGQIVPLGCATFPPGSQPKSVSLLAKSANGLPISVAVTYADKEPRSEMTLIGLSHTLVTDGFSFVRSDAPTIQFQGEADEVYQRAIYEQDQVFVRACGGEGSPLPWGDTIALLETIEKFRKLSDLS